MQDKLKIFEFLLKTYKFRYQVYKVSIRGSGVMNARTGEIYPRMFSPGSLDYLKLGNLNWNSEIYRKHVAMKWYLPKIWILIEQPNI